MKQFIGSTVKQHQNESSTTSSNSNSSSNNSNNKTSKDNKSLSEASTTTIAEATTTAATISDTLSSAFSNYFPVSSVSISSSNNSGSSTVNNKITKPSFAVAAKSVFATSTKTTHTTPTTTNADNGSQRPKKRSSLKLTKPTTTNEQAVVKVKNKTSTMTTSTTPHTTPVASNTLHSSYPESLTIEQVELIAAPDLNQSKLVAEALKRKADQQNNNANQQQLQHHSNNNHNKNSSLSSHLSISGSSNAQYLRNSLFNNNIKAFQERAKERWIGGLKSFSEVAETAKETAKGAGAEALSVVMNANSYDESDGSNGGGHNNMASSTTLPVLEGIVWKRREGLGKQSYQPWVKRRLVLSGNSLIYYVLENEPDVVTPEGGTSLPLPVTTTITSSLTSPTYTHTPRGTFYLLKDSFSIRASLGHHTHAPTPFVITIVPKLTTIETKWKLCFQTHNDMIRWSTALMNVVVQLSIYKFKEKVDNEQEKQQWKMMEEDDSSSSEEDEGPEEIPVVSPKRSLKRSNSSRDRKQHLFLALWVWSNLIILYTCYCYSYLFFILSVLLYNGVTVAIFISFSSKNNFILGKERSASFRKSFCSTKSDFKLEREKRQQPDLKEEKKKKKKREKQPLLKLGASTIKHCSDNQININENQIQQLSDKLEWNTISPSLFQVRSHDYLTSKIKIPSPGSLYDLFAVDIFESDKRIPNISSRIQLPTKDMPTNNNDWNCPELLIFYLSLPIEAPSLGFSSSNAVDEGLGLILVCYFRLKDSTKQILKQLHSTDSSTATTESTATTSNPNQSQINGVKLFTEWCKRSPTDPAFQGRFKLIPISNNLDEVGVPSYMQKYRNKPLLIKRSGTTGVLTSIHKEILEFEVNFYPFPYLAKQGLSYLRTHYLSKMDLSLAFVIEGRCKDELPEVVVGCMNISKQDLDLMQKI